MYEQAPDTRKYPNHEMLEVAQTLKEELSLTVEHVLKSLIKTPEFASLAATPQNELLPHIELCVTQKEISETIQGFDHIVLPEDRAKENVLMIFKLPEHMRRSHFKLDNRASDNLWERLYAKLMPYVWAIQDSVPEQHGVTLYRVNPQNNHNNEINGYYYMWMLSPHPAPNYSDEDIENLKAA